MAGTQIVFGQLGALAEVSTDIGIIGIHLNRVLTEGKFTVEAEHQFVLCVVNTPDKFSKSHSSRLVKTYFTAQVITFNNALDTKLHTELFIDGSAVLKLKEVKIIGKR